jgi:hypothetical protein
VDVIVFQSRLSAKLASGNDYREHMDRKYKMCGILANAINEMRSLGATQAEIAETLRYAAIELSTSDPA